MKNLLLILMTLVSIPSFAQTCVGWGDGLDSIKTRRYYQEYRKLLNQHHYDDAEFFWSYVFKKAPSATKNIYLDGVKIYKHFYKKEERANKKAEYLNTIVSIFDQRAKCLPEDLPNILARKAVQLHWLDVDSKISYEAFLDVMRQAGQHTPSFALVPGAKVTAQAYLENKITEAERSEMEEIIKTIAHANIDAGNDTENYYGALMNVQYEFRLADEQLVNKTIADIKESPLQPWSQCEQVTSAYRRKLDKRPDDEMLLSKAINVLRQMECQDAAEYSNSLIALQEERMRKKMEGQAIAARGTALSNANLALKNGEYEKAITFYREAIEETSENELKVNYHYQIAKILYAKLDKKSEAKTELLQLLAINSNHGEAYLMMGDLYLLGAKECFPKDSFTQKMVLYAAIDKWEKAKEVDNSMAADADSRISKYKNYLPSQSELFLARSRFKRKTYTLGCWINEKVKVDNLK